MTSLPSKVPPPIDQSLPNNHSIATSTNSPAIQIITDPYATIRVGRITKSTNRNIDLERKKSANPTEDKADDDDDSIANAPISTFSFSSDATHNQKDAASKYRKLITGAALEQK